jgi:hypothetical protein
MSAFITPCYGHNGLFDLSAPRPEDVDFAAIAATLSRLPRFGAMNRGHGIVSVGQHCVMGAEAIRRETGNSAAALAFLLHDAHEGFGLGDWTVPAVAAVARAMDAEARPFLHDAIRMVKHRLDDVIMAAAGCERWVLHSDLVIETDRRMGEAEAHWLFRAPPPAVWPAGMSLAPELWGWSKSEERWLDMFHRLTGRDVR